MVLMNVFGNCEKTYMLQSFFRSAVRQNDLQAVVGLIQHHREGIDLNGWDNQGICPIHQCCIDGSKKLISVLLKGGADINAADPKGWTSLHTTAAIGDYELTKYLVKNGADMLSETMNGELPIDLSLNVSIALLLGTEMKAQGFEEEADLYFSRVTSYEETLSSKRNVNMYFEKKILLSNTSSDEYEEKKQKPLRRKSTQRKDKLSRSISNKHSFKSLKGNERSSYSSRYSSSSEEMEGTVRPPSILKKSCSYDSSSSFSSCSTSPSSSRPSSCSSSDGDLDDSDVISDVISFTSYKSRHSVQFDDETLFMAYVQENDYVKLANLLDNIKDVSLINSLDRKGLSAVHWAAIKGYTECLEILNNFGADMNISDPFGWTPLHAAVATKNLSCVSKLLELNVDVYALTKDGESVFDWSPEEDILRVLKDFVSQHIRSAEVRCTSI